MAAEPEGSAPSRAHICIVDDDPRARQAMAALLDACGLRYRAFESGEALLAWPDLHAFDLAIFDITLPGVDGFTLQARVSEACPTLPFLFVSGLTDDATLLRAQHAGAFAFLPKPLDPDRLLATIDRVFDVAGAGR